MKKLILSLCLIFAASLPALAEEADGTASSAEGAMVDTPAEKPAPKKKKKVKKTKRAADAEAETDEGALNPADALKPVERKKEKKAARKENEKAAKAAKKAAKRTDGLVIEDVKVGSGMEAQLGKTITVHYKGTLMSGKVFDESYGGDPISFALEEGRLIKGWTEGIPGMKVGGKRKLTIPYAMAYGERGTPDGTIPPRSDLKFEVELIKVE